MVIAELRMKEYVRWRHHTHCTELKHNSYSTRVKRGLTDRFFSSCSLEIHSNELNDGIYGSVRTDFSSRKES